MKSSGTKVRESGRGQPVRSDVYCSVICSESHPQGVAIWGLTIKFNQGTNHGADKQCARNGERSVWTMTLEMEGRARQRVRLIQSGMREAKRKKSRLG